MVAVFSLVMPTPVHRGRAVSVLLQMLPLVAARLLGAGQVDQVQLGDGVPGVCVPTRSDRHRCGEKGRFGRWGAARAEGGSCGEVQILPQGFMKIVPLLDLLVVELHNRNVSHWATPGLSPKRSSPRSTSSEKR